jgi:hypothetical protein
VVDWLRSYEHLAEPWLTRGSDAVLPRNVRALWCCCYLWAPRAQEAAPCPAVTAWHSTLTVWALEGMTAPAAMRAETVMPMPAPVSRQTVRQAVNEIWV